VIHKPKRGPLRARDVQIYLVCDQLTELLIYVMVVFSPWAFGTSQPWSIWVMNSAGYLLGGMLAVKLAIRRLTDYRPPRWEEGEGIGNPKSEIRYPKEIRSQKSEGSDQKSEDRSQKSVISDQWSVNSGQGAEGRGLGAEVGGQRSEVGGQRGVVAARLTVVLAGLTVAILGYCLISALNARATYEPAARDFIYNDWYIPWLPHSFDSSRTRFAFWSYLGLACSFWAVRDWLLGKSSVEERAEFQANSPCGKAQAEFFPARLRRLFWLLAINGGLLGLEGIIQRLEGSGKLLFLVRPRIHQTAATQFGPYAYYANASQYFNLLWPGCLGFWWMLHRSRGFRRNGHHVVLLCCAIMAACPVISTSRGGALITVGMLALATPFLVASHVLFGAHPQQDTRTRLITQGVLALFFAGALALGFSLGWKALKPRMTIIDASLHNRETMYDAFRPMAADYPVFGIGPGTWENVSGLYRISMAAEWPAQLHNDWLETRITFGWVGSALIALAFATVVLRWFARGGIHGGRRFVLLMWLALGGCLVHARFDFPFQMHSIVFLFLVLCATLFNLSRRPSVH
jgi:hypothetical protein